MVKVLIKFYLKNDDPPNQLKKRKNVEKPWNNFGDFLKKISEISSKI